MSYTISRTIHPGRVRAVACMSPRDTHAWDISQFVGNMLHTPKHGSRRTAIKVERAQNLYLLQRILPCTDIAVLDCRTLRLILARALGVSVISIGSGRWSVSIDVDLTSSELLQWPEPSSAAETVSNVVGGSQIRRICKLNLSIIIIVPF